MKTLYTLILSLLVSTAAFSQPYYVFTANKNGNWTSTNIWSSAVRTDGTQKNEYVVPAGYTVFITSAINNLSLGDIQVEVMGILSIQPNVSWALSSGSTIELLNNGSITGNTNSQIITIGGITKYNGSNDQTKTGPAMASSATSVSPRGFMAASLLPVVFTSFTAAKNAGQVILKWSTAMETANDYFEIERSTNGSDWTTIATIKASNISTGAAYAYTDNNAATAIAYYRLKQVDMNGSFTFSTIKAIRNSNTTAAKIYGAAKTVTIELNTVSTKPVVVTVLNTGGQVLQQGQFSNGYKINLAVQSAGIVIVNVTDRNSLNQTAKILL